MLRQILANSVEQLEATPHRGDPWRLNEEALREAARAAHRILNSLAAGGLLRASIPTSHLASSSVLV